MENKKNMFFPGPSGVYEGRQDEEYAQIANELSHNELVERVQRRVQEDGDWVIEHGLHGGDLEMMQKMMEWASRPMNIEQVYSSKMETGPTVESICRELGVACHEIARGIRGG